MDKNEALQKFQDKMNDRNLSSGTVVTYTNYIKQYIDFSRVKDVNELTLQIAQDYVHELRKNELAVQTINATISTIRYFSEIVLDQTYSLRQLPRLKQSQFDPYLFSTDQIQEMLDNTTDPRLRAFILLGFDCGLRVMDVAQLQIQDIDSEKMIIRIHNSKRRKCRIVKMSSLLLQTLRDYCKVHQPHHIENNKHLFYSARNADGHLSKATISAYFHKYIKNFDWYDPQMHFHCLRHTFATNMLEQGCDIFTLKNLLGHSSISSTACYIHLTSTYAQNAFSLSDRLGIH